MSPFHMIAILALMAAPEAPRVTPPNAATLTAPATTATPAERDVARARQAIADAPGRAEAHVELALSLARRARETADHVYYEQGMRAVDEALRLAPESLEARKARVWLLLGQHAFGRALEEAQALYARTPDDPQISAFLTDAHAELGQYAEAEKSAQWVLDVRPGAVPGLTRAAYLRELFGDLEGARQLMEMALERTAPEETEERAWVLAQIGHLRRLEGRPAEAEAALEEALRVFPGYHYALAGLARVRTAQGRPAEAAALMRARYQAAPHPENLYDLAAALAEAGQAMEARAAFTRFEQEALAESTGEDNANRELVLYYADVAGRPADALRVARLEMQHRRDVYTLDVYAWSLHRSGRPAEARQQMEAVLKVGVRDPRILAHARALGLAR